MDQYVYSQAYSIRALFSTPKKSFSGCKSCKLKLIDLGFTFITAFPNNIEVDKL
jgi:hypothetical protein